MVVRRFRELRRVVEGRQVDPPSQAVLRIQDELSEQILAGEPDPAALVAIEQVIEDIGRQLLTGELAGDLDLRTYGDYRISHPANVFMLAVQIGYFLGYSRTDLKALGGAALLHDIGNSRIADGLLDKPGPLSTTERSQVERHADLGADLLADHGFDPKVVAAVRFHHERLDGSGYPRGLAGGEIPEWASIIAVADTYDALLSDHRHRKGLPRALAFDTIVQGSNTLFDRRVVAAFRQYVAPNPLPRRYVRQEVRIPAVCFALGTAPWPSRAFAEDSGALTCEVVDLSRAGACLQSDHDLGKEGDWLVLELSGRDGSMTRFPVRIMWSGGEGRSGRFGVSFEPREATP